MDEALKEGMNVTIAQITKVLLLVACVFTLFMATGCLVEERGRHHDDVVVAPVPPPVVVVRPPVVVVHP
jgi:hypothetical protein